MKKIIRITERELGTLVNKIIKEQESHQIEKGNVQVSSKFSTVLIPYIDDRTKSIPMSLVLKELNDVSDDKLPFVAGYIEYKDYNMRSIWGKYHSTWKKSQYKDKESLRKMSDMLMKNLVKISPYNIEGDTAGLKYKYKSPLTLYLTSS